MRLLLPDAIESQLQREIRVAGRREIGGVLLGELVKPGVFRVAEITLQRIGGTSSTFVRIPHLHAEAIQTFFERTGHRYERFNYLGEWHSHPSYPTRPSGSDVRAMEEILRNPAMALNFAVLSIVKISPAAQFEISSFAFVPGTRYAEIPTVSEFGLDQEEKLAERGARAAGSQGGTPMVDLSTLFDSYSRQARLFPGLLTLFPLIPTAIARFPQLVTSSWGATLVTLAASCGLLYGLSVLSRSRGKKVEKRLLAEWGGWPTTIWLRHRNDNLPAPVRGRYHMFFAGNVPQFVVPTVHQEDTNPRAADASYASAVKWLQERCRGKALPLVEKENAEYGFRRNLRGLKPIGLTVCFAALLIAALAILWQCEALLPAFASLSTKSLLAALSAVKPAALGAFFVDSAAIVGWLAIVRDDWVRSAGDQYAKALLACCDTLDLSSSARPPSAV
jgi:proteasome lid subunit RPN8/RPN11